MGQVLPLSSIRLIVSLRTLIAVEGAYSTTTAQYTCAVIVAHSRTAGARARYSRTEAGRTTAGRTTAGR